MISARFRHRLQLRQKKEWQPTNFEPRHARGFRDQSVSIDIQRRLQAVNLPVKMRH